MAINKISKTLVLQFSDSEKHFGDYNYRYATENKL